MMFDKDLYLVFNEEMSVGYVTDDLGDAHYAMCGESQGMTCSFADEFRGYYAENYDPLPHMKIPGWKKFDPEDDTGDYADYMYGYHPDWVHGDWNPMGIRPIAYEGDHYVSCRWDGCHDNWFSTSTCFDDGEPQPQQPLYVMKRFPIAPPKE